MLNYLATLSPATRSRKPPCTFGGALGPFHVRSAFKELIDAVNSAEGKTWVAGENVRFAGATLHDAKILMGTLQDVENITVLPYKVHRRTMMHILYSILLFC